MKGSFSYSAEFLRWGLCLNEGGMVRGLDGFRVSAFLRVVGDSLLHPNLLLPLAILISLSDQCLVDLSFPNFGLHLVFGSKVLLRCHVCDPL